MAWRWIFLIEGMYIHFTHRQCFSPFHAAELSSGVMSIGSGFFVMVLLPPVPERVNRFFTEGEKQIAIRRSKQAFNTPHTGIKLKPLRAAVTDRKVWFYGTTQHHAIRMYFSIADPVSSFLL
jgi:hypothetical protein